MTAEEVEVRVTFVIYLSVSVDVGLPHHLVHFVLAELLAEVDHDVAQLLRVDRPVAVAVEHPERLPHVRLQVVLDELARHQLQKLHEIHRSVPCSTRTLFVHHYITSIKIVKVA